MSPTIQTPTNPESQPAPQAKVRGKPGCDPRIIAALIGAGGAIIAAIIGQLVYRALNAAPRVLHYTVAVSSATGGPIASAMVAANIGGKLPLVAVTGPDGVADLSFQPPKQSQFSLDVTASGYVDVKKQIPLDFSGTKYDSVKMEKKAGASGDQTRPTSPGKFTLGKLTSNKLGPVERLRSTSWQQHSSNDDLSNSYRVAIPAGYKLADTPKFVTEWSQGSENDQWNKRLDSGPSEITCTVRTVHHGFGTSGKVNFHLEFDVQKIEESWEYEDIPLGWNSSVAREVMLGKWKLIADFYDGEHREFIEKGSYKYLSITEKGSLIVISIGAHP